MSPNVVPLVTSTSSERRTGDYSPKSSTVRVTITSSVSVTSFHNFGLSVVNTLGGRPGPVTVMFGPHFVVLTVSSSSGGLTPVSSC